METYPRIINHESHEYARINNKENIRFGKNLLNYRNLEFVVWDWKFGICSLEFRIDNFRVPSQAVLF